MLSPQSRLSSETTEQDSSTTIIFCYEPSETGRELEPGKSAVGKQDYDTVDSERHTQEKFEVHDYYPDKR